MKYLDFAPYLVRQDETYKSASKEKRKGGIKFKKLSMLPNEIILKKTYQYQLVFM